MATTPQFANTPNLGANLSAARISTANTNRDGTGTLATLVTGGANGTRVDRVNMRALSTTTAGILRFYLADAEGTPNIRLIHEIAVSAITPSATVRAGGYDNDWVRSDGQPVVIVPSGWTLRVSTEKAESFDVIPIVSGDF